ncbi:MAG TPA: FAD-dependent oxidoreductase [Candidatus Limnocylindria bacterium]|nr:FAD-dependent oxidoreductase [Candidatus Limnocylindria bacterium]
MTERSRTSPSFAASLIPTTIVEPERETPVIAETDVLVVGGGAAGLCAAIAAARNGARVILTERYPHLGGLASGGQVLVLDDMADASQKTVAGISDEIVDRLDAMGAAVYPPPEDQFTVSEESWAKWGRWGLQDNYARTRPKKITYAVAFDPEALKFVSLQLIDEAGVTLRLHSTFVDAIVRDGQIRGGIFETKSGRQAILARVVVDASGDGDVYARAGAPFEIGSYIMTVVHRFANVDVDEAIAWERAHPEEAAAIHKEIKAIYGGSWDYWWLRTPIDGVVWCNCPHIPDLNGLSVEDQTYVEYEARKRIQKALAYAKQHLPGFQRAALVDTAPQLGVRQTRLLRGEYVMTKQVVLGRTWFADRIGMGRDYYYPYRVMLPLGIEDLLVAGRHFSATSEAQRMSREIPPMFVMGQAAGVAAALAVREGISPRQLDVGAVQETLRRQGAYLGADRDPAEEATPAGATVGA